MRWGKAAFMMVLSLSFSAQAQEDVMVDLSVLDELSSSYITSTEPLFPEFSEQKAKVVQKAQKAPIATKTSKQKKKEKVKKKTETILIPAKQDTPSEEEKIVVVDVEPVEPLVKDKNEGVPQSEPQAPLEKQENASIEVVDVEPAPEENVPVPMETLAEKTAEIKSKPMVEKQAEQITENAIKSSEDTVSSEVHKPILVEQNNPHNNEIVFENGISELTSEQMSQIDNIVGHFKNSVGNKVAIYSYNVNDGVDTFRKKRISLNRAIEIRSYLLRQGFKNFSIKVININSDSDKINTVELEEI